MTIDYILDLIPNLEQVEEFHLFRSEGQPWWKTAEYKAREAKSPDSFIPVLLKYKDMGFYEQMVWVIGRGYVDAPSKKAALFYIEKWSHKSEEREISVRTFDSIVDLKVVFFLISRTYSGIARLILLR